MSGIFKTTLAVAALACASCATGQTVAPNRLVGKWRSSLGAQVAEYRFEKDGTFSGHVTSGRQLVSDFTGRWSVRGGTIFYEYTGDRIGRIPAGTLDRDKLLSAAKDHYVIEAADGSRRKYLRMVD